MDKKFYILTLGCQMNKNDSERIAGLLLSHGYQEAAKAEEADIIVLNTCSVRQSAEERVYGLVGNWNKLRARNPNLLIIVTGCMAGRDKDGKIRKKLAGVDLFFKIDELSKLGERLGQSAFDDYLSVAPARADKFRAYITIQTGCDNFCTYCIVPQARGRERNRPMQDVLSEIKRAVTGGAKEVVLLGQVVNNYKIKNSEIGDDFAALLGEINQIPGEFRVHFTAADPQYFNDEQIEALKLPKQVNYLHLPVQSGDNEILHKMNRKYTREEYAELVRKIRAAKPEIALGTDIIVGFCGETDAQFQNTVDLYRQCDFDISFHAMYSARPGTAAAQAFVDDVPPAIKKQRWETLQKMMEEIVLRKNQKYLGQTVRVLVEKCEDDVCSGNSDELKLVQFAGATEMIGTFQKIKINFADKWVLRGVKID